MSLKIICISDTHMRDIKDIPDGDVLIHSGDFSISQNTYTDLVDFIEWFSYLPHKYKILVPGNHDWCFQDDEKAARKIADFYGITVLINESINIKGFNFYGTPDQPVFYNWAFNKTSEELKESFAKIPLNTDVLITHTPPFGKLDTVIRQDAGSVGCPFLLMAVNKVKPMVHIFGHIHEAYGTLIEDDTTFVNCSLVNVNYKAVNKPIIYELKEKCES